MNPLAADLRALSGLFARSPGPASLAWMLAGLFAGWWLYVPIHELLHVAGCVVAGGSVSRLELDPIYGAHALAAVFDFVHPASDYAGQLTGFETGGSDVVYLSCVLAPYVLTVFPGFWAWQQSVRAAASRPSPARIAGVGALLVLAAAPLMSLPGDYYEAGSILVSAAAGSEAALAWRSDDVFRLVAEWPGPWRGADLAEAAFVLALTTMLLGSWLGRAVRGTSAPSPGADAAEARS